MLDVAIHRALVGFTLDLRFQHREGVLILFGRSGAGKTTALRMICGIDRPTRGTIRFAGRTWFSSDQRVNVPTRDRAVGFIFQQHNLFPHMTAHRNIAYAATDRDDIERWVDAFHIGHVMDRHPGRLSGGEQQRVAIVRALVTRPKLLLMDEPLSAVDVATRATLLDELRQLPRTSGIPIVYVTHNVGEAYRLGDRVIVLDTGRIIHDGVPIEVFRTPTSVPLANLSGTENVLDGVVAARNDDDRTMDLRVGATTLHVPLYDVAVGERAVVAIRPEDILIATGETHGTSARNQLRGRIVEVRHDTLPSILVELPGGPTLRAHITARSLQSLRLAVGVEVYLLIKAWSCHPVESDTTS